MKPGNILFAISFLSGILFINTSPAAAYYRGVVSDSTTSALLESVKVQQKGTATQVYTNSQGQFAIAPSVSVLWNGSSSGKSIPLFFNPLSRSITWNGNHAVAICLYNINGAIKDESGTRCGAGAYVIPRLADGVYILELNVDGIVFREKIMAAGNTVAAGLPDASRVGAMGKAGAVSDTLVFTKPGYLPLMQEVAGGDTGLVMKMTVQATRGVMKFIPGGTFRMGGAYFMAEQPSHPVAVSSFYMDSTEVTQVAYTTVMQAIYPGAPAPGWTYPQYGLGNTNPAYSITWFDAVLYCNARSKRDGLDTCYTYATRMFNASNCTALAGIACDFAKKGCRLPTEAEWEFACRARSTTDFYWGKNYNPYPATTVDSNEVSSYAVWYRNAYNIGSANANYGTHPVATKLANGFGLYDMSGNVEEWCNDWYGDTYYSISPSENPKGPGSGYYRVQRGSYWSNNALYLRSATRIAKLTLTRGVESGFRVVLPAR